MFFTRQMVGMRKTAASPTATLAFIYQRVQVQSFCNRDKGSALTQDTVFVRERRIVPQPCFFCCSTQLQNVQTGLFSKNDPKWLPRHCTSTIAFSSDRPPYCSFGEESRRRPFAPVSLMMMAKRSPPTHLGDKTSSPIFSLSLSLSHTHTHTHFLLFYSTFNLFQVSMI